MPSKRLSIFCLCFLLLMPAACGDESGPAAPVDGGANTTQTNATAQAALAPPASNVTAQTNATAQADAALPSSNATAQDSAAAPKQNDAADLEARKWNSYVILANETEPKVLALLEDYIANFPERDYRAPKKDFTYQRPATAGAPVRGVGASLQEAMANAASEPLSDLDGVALAYAGALKKLWEALNAADAYYSNREHEKDNFAGGKEYHSLIVESSLAYAPVSDDFSQALMMRDEAMMRESLNGLREQGMPLHAAVLDVVLAARGMERELRRQGLNGAAPQQDEAGVTAFDALGYAGAANTLKASVQALDALLDDKAQRTKEDLGDEAAAALRTSAERLLAFTEKLPEHLQKTTVEGKTGEEADYVSAFAGLLNAYISQVNASLQ